MKSLIAYLFILFNLGLIFNFNVKANVIVYEPNFLNKDEVLCLIKRNNSNGYSYFYVDESEIYKLRNKIIRNIKLKALKTTEH